MNTAILHVSFLLPLISYYSAGNEVHLFKYGAFLPARALPRRSAPVPRVVALLTKSEPARTFLGTKSELVGILHRFPIYFHAD